MANKFNFDKVIANLQRTKRDLPVKLANETKNYFLSSWNKQGFDGQKWQEVERRKPGTVAYMRAKPSERTRAILVGKGSGRLRRDVANSLRAATFEKIIFRVENPYAQIHNEGGMGRAFGKHSFKMPKRQFIGQTNELRNKQIAIIKQYIGGIWRV